MSGYRWRCCIVAATLGTSPAMATGDPLPPDLAQAAAAYDRAQIDGDRAALERLLADDYRLSNSGGAVETRAQFIAESSDPSVRLDPFVVIAPTRTVWRDGAVLAGEVRLTGTSGGSRFAGHLRFADVWAKRGGRWRVVFTQATRVPD